MISRRVMGLIAVVAVLVAAALVAVRQSGQGSGNYRFDAIFDVARGIGPQQVVKIAGAPVGTVIAVHLTRDYQARVEMSIQPQFGPFRQNASCQIAPEGLISENFVNCDPGTPSSPVLAPQDGQAPTVPVTHDTEPVSLQDLFNIWSTPVSDRLTVLLDELGIGVSGRAGDIQAILYRADPGLAAARKAITLVNRQRAQLGQLIAAANPVIGQLADHDPAVQNFLTSTARLTTVTAEHRDGLSQTIARLPALLRSAQPALEELDGVAADAPPLLEDLRSAAPAITELTHALPPFADRSISTLDTLSPALSSAASALTAATPTLERARQFAVDADPAGEGLDQLLVSLRDSGAIESLLRGLYNGAALTSHYDADSHVIFADMIENQCLTYATVASASCDAHLDGTATTLSSAAAERKTGRPSVTAASGQTLKRLLGFLLK